MWLYFKSVSLNEILKDEIFVVKKNALINIRSDHWKPINSPMPWYFTCLSVRSFKEEEEARCIY